jgi:hypothetical protein
MAEVGGRIATTLPSSTGAPAPSIAANHIGTLTKPLPPGAETACAKTDESGNQDTPSVAVLGKTPIVVS